MAKYLFLILILGGFSLLYPFHDLYVKEDPFNPAYTLVKKGYWSRGDCVNAAEAQNAEVYRCSKRTMLGSFMGSSVQYGKAGLEEID